MGSRRTSLVLAVLLMGTLVGGVASAAPRIAYGEIRGMVYDGAGAAPCTKPFDDTHVVIVDAWDSAGYRWHDPTSSMVTDGTGVYSIPDVEPGDYKVRYRVFDSNTELVAYWWYHPSTTARTFEDGEWATVVSGADTIISPCLPGFTGGGFKGKVTSAAAGFAPECIAIMAFEGASGIFVGLLDPVRATGFYDYATTLPPGHYTALAFATESPGCPSPPFVLDQWWGGHSGRSLFSTSSTPDLVESARTFAVSAGSTTSGIRFDLIPIGTCDGQTPTIVGTTSDDSLTGTPGDDVIQLFNGDDVADGSLGDDTICGGRGNDLILGGAGSDRIFGGPGRDRIRGQGGPDVVRGGPRNDRINGGHLRDRLSGNGGDDVIVGGGGNDRMRGGPGDDYLDGGPGGSDTGNGGAGSDTCTPATENPISC